MRRMWTLSALLGVHLAAIAATPLDAHITLSVSKDRGMHADIVLSHPVTRLEFGRQADGLRARIWQSEDRRLVMDGDAIISTDHKPFRHVPLKLLPYSEPVTLNYAVMQQF